MRIRQHVNPTLAFFETFRGVRPTLDPARPVEVEIGCADAQFLFERAAQEPARDYVGLEIREELVHLVNKKARATGAPVSRRGSSTSCVRSLPERLPMSRAILPRSHATSRDSRNEASSRRPR